MENKKWTLEEAQEDYRKTQIRKCCNHCKFYAKDIIEGFDMISKCRVKGTYIDEYESYEEGTDCKYFTYTD